MTKAFTIVGIGEILFDCFGAECVPGGAPFNFAYCVKSLGMNGTIASRIGKDDLGRRLLDEVMPTLGMSAEYLQVDETHRTGVVNVLLDPAGNASFEIVEDVAWDYLEMTPTLKQLAESADAISFGTLAQRTAAGRKTIDRFVDIAHNHHALVLLDLNLRQKFYSADLLRRCCLQADILKMDEGEMIIARTLLGGDRMDEEEFVLDLIRTYHMEIVCLTRGEAGCTLFTAHDRIDTEGFGVKVKDTVGAGDAFSAGLLVKFLEGAGLRDMARYANLCGSYVASRHGATPPLSPAIIDEFETQFPRRP
jgi:fructokinase